MNRKIAVIGAGPSGITTLYWLNKKGLTNIDIYGDIDKSQPKTIIVDNVSCDVGTCYIHSGYYNSVKTIAKEYSINITGLLPPQETTQANPTIFSDTEDLDFIGYLKLGCFILHSVFWRFLNKTELSKDIYSVSFKDYVETVGLGSLVNDNFVLNAGGVSQGYGFFDEVSAYHLFRWFRPSIFLTPLMNKYKKGTMIVDGGYGNLYRKIYDNAQCNKFINNVIKIENVYIPDQGIKTLITLDDETFKQYDEVFVCCPLTNIITPLKDVEITNECFEHSNIFSYLWISSKNIPILNDRVYIKDLITNKQTDMILSFRKWGVTNDGHDILWGFGMHDETTDISTLKTNIKNQIESFNLDIFKEIYFDVLQYNQRLTMPAIKNGAHIEIEKMQGRNNIWYLGGQLSHWDVDSICEHSKQIVNRSVYRNTSSFTECLSYYFTRFIDFWINEW